MARVYSNLATEATTTGVDAVVTTIPVDTTEGWPTPGAGDIALGTFNLGDASTLEFFSYTGKTSTSFTGVTRGLDGTAAQAHSNGVAVRHAASAVDVQSGANASSGGGAEMLAVAQLNPATATTITVTGTTWTPVDATNLQVTFVAPASGQVVVRMFAYARGSGNGDNQYWALADSSNVMRTDSLARIHNREIVARASAALFETGLTPGASYTWRWMHVAGFSTQIGNIDVGGRTTDTLNTVQPGGPATMEVWSA